MNSAVEFCLVFIAGFGWGFALATRGERVRMREMWDRLENLTKKVMSIIEIDKL